MPKKITHSEFVENLNKTKPHLEVLSEYNGNKNYITVRCKIHDHTWQSKPNWLMHEGKFDCQKCYDDRRGETRKNDVDFFIKKGNEIHNNKFDYSKVFYVNNKTSVTIVCPIHGEFKMTPEKHLTRKQGCPKCANKYVTTEDFIKKARKIHGDHYDYSNTKYINTLTKLSIICKKHGEFWQTPEVHLYSKCGCPVCNESKLEKLLFDILSNHQIKFISQYKNNWLGKQSLDFYLTDYKIAIECQGEQHFKPVKYFGGDQRFEIDIKRDILKNQLCEDNEIKLIYITDLINLKKTILNKSIFLNIYNENNLICSSFKNIEKHLLKKIL